MRPTQENDDSMKTSAPLSVEARYLLDVLRDFLNEREPTEPPGGFDERRFLRLAKRQRVEAIVADELVKRSELFSPEFVKALAKLRARAILDDVAFETTVEKVNAEFEKNGIRYLPLKGAITKTLYPQSYQRSVCDYDVLLEEPETARAKALLEKNLDYRVLGVSPDHYALINERGLIEVEAHRTLGFGDSTILNEPWRLAVPCGNDADGKKFQYRFTNEIFYLHMLLHIAKHWLSSGVFVRMFVDVRLFNRKFGDNFDRGAIEDSLRSAGIAEFAGNVERATRVWFDGEEEDETSMATARRLLDGATRDLANDPNPFAKRKNRYVDFVGRVLGTNYFKMLRWEIAEKPFGTRWLWRVYYWLKLTANRLKVGGLGRRAFAVLFKRNAQETNRNAERRFGFALVPDEPDEEKKD